MSQSTEEPNERTSAQDVPEQRQEEHDESHGHPHPRMPEILAVPPRVTVIGYMDSQIAIRLSWKTGMVAISQSRFKFLRDELGIDVMDDPENYLF